MYTIRFHASVEKDLKHISQKHRALLHTVCVDKLRADPVGSGKPLQHTLKSYRSMRVGVYRVIYSISRKTVYLLSVGHRADIYQRAVRRIGK
jgi:mRNA-degrading endonuclease RelE of RelBE toxin-antitoxin system